MIVKIEYSPLYLQLIKEKARPLRIVVMTGATSGLGLHAVRLIAAQRGTRVIIGARGSRRSVPRWVEVIPLDLASLVSVRAFVDVLTRQLGDMRIDMLILNAGMQSSNISRHSAEGYELTFAVNHLAHYLLARLLMPYMADNGRLVITTSDMHDRAVIPIAPKTLEPLKLARPGKSCFGTGVRAYKTSKLCNLMTAHCLARQAHVKNRHIKVVAFNPGLTSGTDLCRDNSRMRRVIVTLLMHTVFRLVSFFRSEYIMSTAQRSGEALAAVAIGTVVPPPGSIYIMMLKGKPTFPKPSRLALSHHVQERLWRESAAMVGIA